MKEYSELALTFCDIRRRFCSWEIVEDYDAENNNNHGMVEKLLCSHLHGTASNERGFSVRFPYPPLVEKIQCFEIKGINEEMRGFTRLK